MIPFTQYLRPDGRKRHGGFDRAPEVEELAKGFMSRGGWFEAEILTTGEVSLTACRRVDGEAMDVAIEIVENGPGLGEAVDRLVRSVA